MFKYVHDTYMYASTSDEKIACNIIPTIFNMNSDDCNNLNTICNVNSDECNNLTTMCNVNSDEIITNLNY